jgi:SAM-dependent methyltransferase
MPAGALYRVRPDDPEYRHQLQAEAAFWDRPQYYAPGHQDLPPVSYWNERFTGDAGVPWHAAIPRYGAFRRGCSLGTSLNQQRDILAQNPGLHMTVYDISDASLAEIEREVAVQHPGRVTLERADLNFIELPERAFDLIVSNGVLHHVINIEHVAHQINRALTDDGFFFLYDYVGETRFAFSDEKKRAFEFALQALAARQPRFRDWYVQWPDFDAMPGMFSPFEAIRSQDTLDVLARALVPLEVRPAGTLLGLILFVRPPLIYAAVPDAAASRYRRLRFAIGVWRRRLFGGLPRRVRVGRVAPLLAEGLVPADRAAMDDGSLRPMFAFAVYRKRKEAP